MLVDMKDVFLARYAKTVREVTGKHGPAAGQARIQHLNVNDRIKINMINKGVRV